LVLVASNILVTHRKLLVLMFLVVDIA